jgi:iron complex transport system ATP-binding protein
VLLEGIELDVAPGELVAVVGPNGAGKTTLLRTIAGFAAPDAGDVLIDGVELRALSTAERARSVTLLGSDGDGAQGLSVRDAVATGRFAHRPWWDWADGEGDRRATEAALRAVALEALAGRPIETLSSGERQRARLALALAQEAGVVLLDEPTSHLDARFALEILTLLRALAASPRCVVVVLHDLNEAAAIADTIVLLGEGRVLAVGPPETALDPALLERAYGVPFEHVTIGGQLRVFPFKRGTRSPDPPSADSRASPRAELDFRAP